MTYSVAERVDCDGVGPSLRELCPDVQRDQWLVLDDEDRMTGKTGALHVASPARLSAIAGDTAFLRVATCLEPSINPKMRATSVMIDA
jgi:hypothetical protein